MKINKIAMLVALTFLTSASGALAQHGGSGGGDRLRCKAKGADVEFQARYEVKKAATPAERRRFRVELEGGSSTGLTNGQQLSILVDGANVGVLTVSAFNNGDVAGETRFDSRAKGGESLPFPSNFPAVSTGSEVSLLNGDATVIGCTFE